MEIQLQHELGKRAPQFKTPILLEQSLPGHPHENQPGHYPKGKPDFGWGHHGHPEAVRNPSEFVARDFSVREARLDKHPCDVTAFLIVRISLPY
jgi:hypothetical protein